MILFISFCFLNVPAYLPICRLLLYNNYTKGNEFCSTIITFIVVYLSSSVKMCGFLFCGAQKIILWTKHKKETHNDSMKIQDWCRDLTV